MTTILHYTTNVTLHIHSGDLVASVEMGNKPLSEVVDFMEGIFNDETCFHGEYIDRVYAVDTSTGELLACCKSEDTDDSLDDGADEMGFNPYLGTYDYDC